MRKNQTVMAHATEANEHLSWDSSPPRAVVQSFGNTPTLIPQARDSRAIYPALTQTSKKADELDAELPNG